jgi:hypothetical protein
LFSGPVDLSLVERDAAEEAAAAAAGAAEAEASNAYYQDDDNQDLDGNSGVLPTEGHYSRGTEAHYLRGTEAHYLRGLGRNVEPEPEPLYGEPYEPSTYLPREPYILSWVDPRSLAQQLNVRCVVEVFNQREVDGVRLVAVMTPIVPCSIVDLTTEPDEPHQNGLLSGQPCEESDGEESDGTDVESEA